MVSTRQKSFEHYVKRIERKLLRKWPHLTFTLWMHDDREGTIYYEPYFDEETWDITHATSSVAIDALIKDDYVIHIQPAPP